MSEKNRFKKDKGPKTLLADTIDSVEKINENFNISFQYLDTSQKYGSSFLDWQNCG